MTTALVDIAASSLPTIRHGGELKHVRMIHRKAIALHLAGHPGVEVDALLKKSNGWSSGLFRQPKIRAILERAYEDYDGELKALIPNAIESLRRNVECGDPAVEVRASSEVLKLNNKYDSPEGTTATAEDVVEQLWERYEADGSHTVQKLIRRRVLTARGDLSENKANS